MRSNSNTDGKRVSSLSSFELLGELPVELVVDKILNRFADEKSLSTLAFALSGCCDAGSSDSSRSYEMVVYVAVPMIARERLRQQACMIAGGETAAMDENEDGAKYAGMGQWIRRMAEADDSVYTPEDKQEKEECKQQLWSVPSTAAQRSLAHEGMALAEQLRQTKLYRKLKAMRRLSENLALSYYLRQCIQQSRNQNWEMTVWVGQLSVVTSNADAACLRKTVRTEISAPMPLRGPPPSSHYSIIPGASLVMDTHRTPTGHFRLEPYNLLRPLPPWGRVRGLKLHDKELLQDLATTLDASDGSRNTICVPSPQHQQSHRDPLNVRILTQRQAQSRLRGLESERLPPSNAPSRTTEWIVTEVHHPSQDPLVCCWHDDSVDGPDNNEIDDTVGEEEDRAFVIYVIALLKTQERLVRQDECTH